MIDLLRKRSFGQLLRLISLKKSDYSQCEVRSSLVASRAFNKQLPVLMVLLVSVWLPDLAFTANGPVIPPGKGSQCVADTDLMRREHMNLLNHQRDETVVKGIRNQPFSLAECVDCHAQTDAANQPVRIDAEGQFCESCHSYAAVKIDCFSCHAAVPQLEKTGAVHNPPWSSSTAKLASAMRWQLLVTDGIGVELSDYLNDNRSDNAHWNPRAKR